MGARRLISVTHLAIIFKIFPFTLIFKFGAINIYESTRHGEEEKQIWSLIKRLLWVGGDSLCLNNLSSLGSNLRFCDLNRGDQIVFTLSHAIVDVAELLQDQGLAMAFNSTMNGKR